MPIYGTLQPGESEQVTLTFYGHANIRSEICAVCEVDGGPSYDIKLKGEASLVSYKFDCQEIDYDKIVSNGVLYSCWHSELFGCAPKLIRTKCILTFIYN